MLRAINPSTEAVVGEYPPDTAEEIEAKVRRAAVAFESWRGWSVSERCRVLHALAGVLRRERHDLAPLMAQEMGKPLNSGEFEINKCMTVCEHFAQHADELLRAEPAPPGGGRGYVRFDPLGPILAIMPWNFPFWQVFRFAAASLAAGNVVVLKHAPNVPACARAIEQMFIDAVQVAGGVADVLVNVVVEDNAVVRHLCTHPLIRGITLTGSAGAGAAVAAAAGAAIKKSVLELGGSDPFIVLKDADVESAATSAAESRCIESGQSCIAAKRFIVEARVMHRFVHALVAAMKGKKVGNPLDRANELGPLARLDLLELLQKQVDQSVAAGAKILTGGARLPIPGYFYPPTVMTDVRPGMAVFDEETFGPVAAVVSAADGDEAIALANCTRFGLGASIWTRDITRAEKLAATIDAGNVFINAIVRSDPRFPFGGIKSSGWGRELAEAGIREFTNVKTVWVGKP